MKKYIFLIFIIASSVTAQNVDSLFVSANNLYKIGDFEAAIEKYKKIEAQRFGASELYFNLGNSYYKLNKVVP
jgi:tetratricopeptide (TPR) repeat protein